MRLLYCYIRFLDKSGKEKYYHGQKSVELNLSTKHRFAFYPDENMFVREDRKAPLPDHFWAAENAEPEHCNIYNINVIAGQNGAGKTTGIHCVMELLDFLHAAANSITHKLKDYSGLKSNQFLLLLEGNSHYYLLSYMPKEEAKTKSFLMNGFSNNMPILYSITNWSRFFKKKTGTSTNIQSFLLRTKVIYMTNTLNQYEFERRIKGQIDHIRDAFIFDVSIGATIGQDTNQFFLYEIYKQVKYIFDKNQLEIRKKIEAQTKKKIIGFKVPDSLRFKLRMQRYKEFIMESFIQQYNSPSCLVDILGALCVGAFTENLNIRLRLKEKELPPIPKQSMEEVSNSTYDRAVLQQMILDVEQQYYDMGMCSEYTCDDCITCLLSLLDGRIASCSETGVVVIGDKEKDIHRKEISDGKEFFERMICCAVNYKENLIVGASSNGDIWVCDADKKFTQLEVIFHAEESITCIAVSHDKKKLFCVSVTGLIYILYISPDLGSAFSKQYSLDFVQDYEIRKIQIPIESEVTSIVVTQNDSVFCACNDGNIYAYIQGEAYTYNFDKFGAATCIEHLPDDRIIIGSQIGCLYVWNPESIKDTLRVFAKEHNGSVTCLTVSPDGTKIISGSENGEIYVWDIQKEEFLYKIEVSDKSVTSVAALSDGQIAGCFSGDNNFKIWNVPEGLLLHEKQKQLLKEIEEDNRNISKSTMLYENEIDKEMPGMGFAHILTENCLRYIKFIYDKKETFFKQIYKVSEDTYEVPLNEDMTDTFAEDMIHFMQKYRYTCEPAYTIDFDWGLSSGEENMLRIFSNLYHIFDRDYSSGKYGDYKIYNNEEDACNKKKKTECDTVLLFLDEADLTLHPEWQRCLIETLTTYIPQVYPASCVKDIQLILTTHSPLLLGDIPGENITYLYCQEEEEKEEGKQNEKNMVGKQNFCEPGETFGQNIHTILRDSFFLSKGTVGAFAAKKINNAAERLIKIRELAVNKENMNDDIVSFKNELQEMRAIINLVAPGVLRIKLEDLFQQAVDALEEKNISQHKKAQELLKTLRKLTPEDRQYVIDAIYQEKSKND